MSAQHLIWEATLDDVYKCQVQRIDESTGELTVQSPTQGLILKEVVRLSYGAAFGPDAGDVAEWQEQCVRVVDADK